MLRSSRWGPVRHSSASSVAAGAESGRGVRSARRQLLLLRIPLLSGGHDAEVIGGALAGSVVVGHAGTGTHLGTGVSLHVLLHLHLPLMLLHHHHLLHFGSHLVVTRVLGHVLMAHRGPVGSHWAIPTHAHRGVHGMHAGHGDGARIARRRTHLGSIGAVGTDLGHHLLALLTLHVHMVMVRHHPRLTSLRGWAGRKEKNEF